MKFGLLVVLAVAVLVPSLSEGRTVSKCELKEKLEQAITLPTQLQQFKEEYLAIVICEANSRSRLNTNLVKVLGKRTTTTTATPTTTQPTTTQPILTDASTLVINRRKRDVTGEESDSAEMDHSEERFIKKSSSLSLGLYGIFKMSEETVGEESSKESSISDEDEDSDEKDEDETEEGGKRKKRSIEDQSSEETKQSSLGLYGIFQLSDETFCNSGYRSSKNKCNTTCDAFTDDNIMDDIDCFVKTDQWRLFLKSASHLCQIGTKNYFDECK
ncbi:uncharacterized protein LOC118492954 [Sander lucioperca]|uniref:uncharacterized protein LOC118492954 n=1 Tax=Sander lucioperca TaxID=283035 RepID=UPI001653C8E0|nr:uncharacterized protein LOC118492954 [Sander lucioperca]XP_035856366.1 uncharacterized protein LOC118492954 [Sander lucioperca]